jgi:predicted thioesterase
MDFTAILKPGLEGQKTETVNEGNTASFYGSGGLDVYATPAMIALMEGSAYLAVQGLLPSPWSTVGTELNVKHISASPSGMKIYAKAELIKIDGRTLSFRVEAFDKAGKIGEGTHERFIIDTEKFLAKLESKKA